MQVNPIYHAIRQAEESTIVCQGGQDSGKTYAILQNICTWCLEYPDLIATVTGIDLVNLKRGALRHFIRIINHTPVLKSRVASYNISDRILTFDTGSIVEFVSFEDEMDARGAKRNILYANEANGMDWEIFNQAWRRSLEPPFFKRLIDYNPSASFWAHDKLIGKPDVKLIISDHRSNHFLTRKQHEDIESIPDKESWRVYARGYTGNLKGIIYKNWINTNDKPDHVDATIWGIDYGYGDKATSGKTAIIRVQFVRPYTLYLKECGYLDGGADEHMIRETLEAHGWSNGQPFYSEHDPNMILALRKIGVHVLQARKGEHSEFNGIVKIKKFQCYYNQDVSPNLHWERTHAKFMTFGDEVTKIVENTKRYHLLAALRYAVFTHFQTI